MRRLKACAACLVLALTLSGCAAFPQARRFKPFEAPQCMAAEPMPKAPDLSAEIRADGDRVVLSKRASDEIQKHIVDLRAVERANRLKAEACRKQAEFLIGIMNNLLAGE